MENNIMPGTNKKSEPNLSNNLESYKSFFNAIPELLSVINEDGNIIEVNNTFIKRLGFSREEIIGKPVLQLYPEARHDEVLSVFSRINKGVNTLSNIPLQTKLGQLIPVFSRMYKGEWDNNPAYFGVSHDVADIKFVEDKYVHYFHSNPAMSCIIELESGVISEVNNAFLNILGFNSADVINKKVNTVLNIDKKLNNSLRNLIQKEGSISNIELLIHTNSGKELPVLFSAEKISIQGTDCFYAVAIDLEQRKKIEARLLESEGKFRDLFNNMNSAFAFHKIILDDNDVPIDYMFLDINDMYEMVFGLKKTELLNKRVRELHYEYDESLIAKFGQVALTGNPVSFSSYDQINDKYYAVRAYSPQKGYFAVHYLDVTREEIALEELYKSERMFKEASALGKIGSWEYNFEEGSMLFSGEWFDIYETEVSNLKMNLSDLWYNVHPDDVLLVKSKLGYTQGDLLKEYFNYRIVNNGAVKYIHSEIDFDCDSQGNVKRMFGIIQDITEKKENELLLEKQTADIKQVITAIAGKTGQEYYNSITKCLNEVSGADYTFIGKVKDNVVSTISIYINGEPGKNVSYDIKGTPCELVVGKKTYVIYNNFSEKFPPKGEWIDYVLSGYIGTPIFDSMGQALGVVVSIYKDPLKNTHFTETIFELFASGIGNEMQRSTAEIKLKESQHRYKWLSESTFEGILITKNGKVIDANEQLENIYGYKLNEISNVLISKLFHPDDFEMVMKRIRNNDSEAYQYRGITKNGKTIHLEVHVRLINMNKEQYRLAVIRDITKQKKQSFEIQENQQLFRSIFDSTPVIAMILNEETEIEQINRFGLSYMVDKSMQPLGKKCGDLLGCIGAANSKDGHRDSKICKNCVVRNATENSLETGTEHLKIETDLVIAKNNDLSIKTFLTSTKLIELNGKRNVLLTLDDITERKQMEEELVISNEAALYNENRYKLLTDLTFEGIMLHREKKIININKAFENMSGYVAGELVGFSFYEKILPEKYYAYVDERLKEDYSSPFEIELMRKDGTLFPAEIEARYFRNNEKKIRVAAIRDISDRKQTEQKVLNAILETEERERANFAQELHDGLGPILSNVQMYFQWLAEADENREFVTEKGNKSLKNAFQTLREISSKLSPHILHNFGIARAIHSYIDQIPDKSGVNIIFEHNINELRYNQSVEITLYRVITELVNNTLKYAQAKQINIKVYQSKTELSIIYNDDGVGLNLFEIESNPQGQGLFNMKSRIKTLKGDIEFESEINKGFIVNIKVPVYTK